MKKSVIIFITLLALISFGTASSAHAFVEPFSTGIIIVGCTLMGFSALKDKISEDQAKSAQVQDQKGNVTQKEVQNKTDNAKEIQQSMSLSAGRS